MGFATRSNRSLRSLVLGSACALGLLAVSACGGDEDGADDAHLMFVTAPGAAITAGEDVAVTWMVHTEGDLHHTEIRACMGHSDDCGLGDMTSFDANFTGLMNGEMYSTNVNIDTAGPWTIVVFAHVGETPHISEAVHATVTE